MQKLIIPRLIFSAIVLMPSADVLGQAVTAEGDKLRGEGIRAAGAGWYNFNTARANAINVGAMRNYNEEVRQNFRNRLEYWANKEAGRKLSREEAEERAEEKLKQLETNPTNDDIKSGEALNVLVSILTDPGTVWNDKIVQLPEAATLKDMVFIHYPNKIGSNETRVLVALSRLGKDIEWPIYLTSEDFSSERNNFVSEVTKLKNLVIDRKFDPKQRKAVDESLKKLHEKITNALDEKGGYLREGKDFYKELTDSIKLFDGNNIGWAKEILYDTERYDAKNVPQLIAFMRHYRLHFADADTGRSTQLYGELYASLKKQVTQLGLGSTPLEQAPPAKPSVPPQPIEPPKPVGPQAGQVYILENRAFGTFVFSRQGGKKVELKSKKAGADEVPYEFKLVATDEPNYFHLFHVSTQKHLHSGRKLEEQECLLNAAINVELKRQNRFQFLETKDGYFQIRQWGGGKYVCPDDKGDILQTKPFSDSDPAALYEFRLVEVP